MAINVENTAALIFGVMAAEVVISHARFQQADDSEPVIRPVSPNVTVAAGERMRLPAGSMDVVYPRGELTDVHMDAVVKLYWTGSFKVDMMTDATTVVADSGYSQQSTSAFTFTTNAAGG